MHFLLKGQLHGFEESTFLYYILICIVSGLVYHYFTLKALLSDVTKCAPFVRSMHVTEIALKLCHGVLDTFEAKEFCGVETGTLLTKALWK